MRAVISYDAANDIIIPELIEYSITISSTPLNSNDTSGSVGEFSLSFHRPYDLDNHLNSRSPGILEGKPVQFNSDYGTIYGLIDTIEVANNETISLQCTSYAGGLNAYNVQAKPQRGGSYSWTGEPGKSTSVWSKGGGGQIKNLVWNPSFEHGAAGTGGWGFNQTSLSTTTNSWGVVEGSRCLQVNEGSNYTDQYFGTSLAAPVGQGDIFPGDFLAVSYYMRRGAATAVTTRFRISWRDADNVEISNWQTGFEPLNATRSSTDPNNHYTYVAGPAPEGTSHVRLLWWVADENGAGWTELTPWTIHLDAVIASAAPTEEKALEQVEQYFDGDSPPEPGALLKHALAYYFSLGNHTVNVVTDPEITDRIVLYPGWSGELWHHLKMLCAAEDIQFVLDGQGYVRVEPVRQEEANLIQVQTLNLSTDSSNLAQKVEVREYNCEAVTGALFYPAGGWSEDTEILSVNAGEYTEQTIEMGGSIETFDPPQMYEHVEKDWDESSAYTIVADDGFPVPILQWQDRGGNITFEINEDYQTMTVKMRGANGIRLDDGNEATSFSLALASDSGSGSRYSTLRIVGDGVIHDREGVLSVNTGVPKEVTGTEVGATVDNPFLFDRERVAKAASRVARQFSGALLTAQIAATDIGEGFGVTDTGARAVLDGRPYRTRELTYTPGGVSISADDDLTHEDVQEALSGKTYGEVQSENEGLTYRNVFMRGAQYD